MIKPITPEEAKTRQLEGIPDTMIEVINELLIQNYNGFSAKILQKDIVAAFIAKTQHTISEIDKNRWLDFEDLYRDNGWEVKYDKPGFNETYSAFFEFKKEKKFTNYE